MRRYLNVLTGYVECNVRRDSICPKYFDKIKIGTHKLNYLLPDKRHIEYNIRRENM